MVAERIAFRYFNPVLYHAFLVVCLLFLTAEVWFLLGNYAFPTAIGAVLGLFILVICALKIAHGLFRDLTGEFIFKQNGLIIKIIWNRREIVFAEIDFIAKEFYDKKMGLLSQATPGQYRIVQTSGRCHLLRVAHKEEENYEKTLRKITRKIYKTNWLGIQLTSRLRESAVATSRKALRFEVEKPVFAASLAKAIGRLVVEANCEFRDLTA